MIEFDNCADFWWSKITGTSMLTTNIADSLVNGHNIVIRIPDDLPWRKAMRTFIKSKLITQSENSSLVIKTIDDKDENPEGEDPGKLILENPENGAKAYGYRPSKGQTIQDYILKQKLLKNTVIWVKGLSPKMAMKWLDFAKGYNSKSLSTGLFLLEINENLSFSNQPNINIYNYADSISSYDLQVFNSFILEGNRQYSENWKRYISTVAAYVSDIDAEFSASLLDSFNLKNEDIMERIKTLAESPEFAQRGREENSNHILSLYRNNDMQAIEHRIWQAQLNILFPIIEMNRIEIINKWQKDIKLSLKNNYVNQYGNRIMNYEDVEFGTLCHMLSARDENGDKWLYIPCDMTRDKIFFMHECRNLLAHANICSHEQVKRLLSY